MKQTDRARLTSELRSRVALIAADLRAKMRTAGPVRERARKLHADEQVGEDFEVWTDLLARRGAVLWVLKSVYVRVLEDRGLISPGRILDPESEQLFEKLAPNLGETAFLRWVYRDLGSARGGLPELFAPQPAEVALPSDELSRGLIRFWRHRDADSGTTWSFAEEKFEGELMGDLYQELDPVVKDRFALCQTPDFVRGFILDRTLTPALEAFGASEVRLLDPACGSGHFLIDGLKRLVVATSAQHPDWEKRRVVAHCLDRVVGMDINDYACALARARLIMTAAELSEVRTLAGAAELHPHVYWADGLEQVEREQAGEGEQLALLDVGKRKVEAPRATLTRPEVRAALAKVLAPKFHAVVANPPYITEKDPARKLYHREKLGKGQRYVSAYREYSLGSPFTERCFQLAVKEGFVGLITSNNFMKREFGKPLIEKVLAGVDLTLVVDTSQAYIPFHGTPTVLLFARNRKPVGESARAVMGKRGETGTPDDPAKGRVWSSIVEGWNMAGFENEFVSVAEISRATFGKHPWSLGGGGAAELRMRLETAADKNLGSIAEIGTGAVTREDNVYLVGLQTARRMGVAMEQIRPLVEGETVRDWAIVDPTEAIWPYQADNLEVVTGTIAGPVIRALWPWRTRLACRVAYGKSQIEHGLQWFEYSMFFADRFRTPLTITFPFVSTHNHFILDRGGKVFKQTAPIVKLPATATEAEHLALLGLLNSSTAGFWMKQVFHCKGSQGINEGAKSALWEQFFEFDATKLRLFPIVPSHQSAIPYARKLDEIARGRAARSIAVLLADTEAWTNAVSLRTALEARRSRDLDDLYRMIALQEELDWLCYRLYGIEHTLPVLAPDEVTPIPPTWLPWVLTLAARDAEIRDMLKAGEDPGEIPTVWFERHRWQPVMELPAEVPAKLQDLIARRQARTTEVPELQLIENSAYKRRWYRPDYEHEEKEALTVWLADRIETLSEQRGRTFTVEQSAAALQDDPRLLAVAEVLAGRPDFSLSQLVQNAIQSDTVPSHRFHVYKETGLDKRAAWERTWDEQRREDAGEKVVPAEPPPYAQVDFLKPEYYRLRGKLDVPKERFIAFTEVPGKTGAETLYGWAGWTPLQRIRALLGIDEELEDAGVPLADRIGVLDSAWRLLPDAAREDPTAANRLKAELQALVGPEGPSQKMLLEWRERFPPPGKRAARKPARTP